MQRCPLSAGQAKLPEGGADRRGGVAWTVLGPRGPSRSMRASESAGEGSGAAAEAQASHRITRLSKAWVAEVSQVPGRAPHRRELYPTDDPRSTHYPGAWQRRDNWH